MVLNLFQGMSLPALPVLHRNATRFFLAVATFVFTASLQAQHHHMESDSTHEHHHHDMDMMSNAPMTHAYSLSLPMSRNGSGTGWMPDSTVMYGHGMMTENWMFMFHWNLFARYNVQDVFNAGNRGGNKFDAPNWVMGMGQRRVGKHGLFQFTAMLSLDPVTVGSNGYPLLFQTGETYHGVPLVDRQHPHDLFSELSVAYTLQFNRTVDLTFYAGYPGEPALGPVAFMHRSSALNNPDAPLSHHWMDATHITNGVGTIGLRIGQLKTEVSVFTGREPDENRYDFDPPKFDSYSLRFLYNPNGSLALQVSRAFITSPEALHPEENITRTTASVIHHLDLPGPNRYVATTLAWGYNQSDSSGEHAILIEPNVQLDRWAVYGRYEWVQKSAEDLNLTQYHPTVVFNIQEITLGASYVFLRRHNNFTIGAQSTVYFAHELKSVYGDKPVAAEVYLRFYPHLMHMHMHHDMD